MSEKQKEAKVQIIFAASRLTELEVAGTNVFLTAWQAHFRLIQIKFSLYIINSFHYVLLTKLIGNSASTDSICRTEYLQNLTGCSTFTASWQPLHIPGSIKHLKLRLIPYPRIQLPSIES